MYRTVEQHFELDKDREEKITLSFNRVYELNRLFRKSSAVEGHLSSVCKSKSYLLHIFEETLNGMR